MATELNPNKNHVIGRLGRGVRKRPMTWKSSMAWSTGHMRQVLTRVQHGPRLRRQAFAYDMTWRRRRHESCRATSRRVHVRIPVALSLVPWWADASSDSTDKSRWRDRQRGYATRWIAKVGVMEDRLRHKHYQGGANMPGARRGRRVLAHKTRALCFLLSPCSHVLFETHKLEQRHSPVPNTFSKCRILGS